MLNDSKFFTTVAVSDRETAREFYEGKLALKQVVENPRGVTYETADGNLYSVGTPQPSN